MTIGLVKVQRFSAIHPEGVLHQQVLIVAPRTAHAVLFEQLHHQREHRRLGAAQIVGSVAVWDVPIFFNHPCKVIRHTLQQIVTAAFGQPQHGKVGVPVVGLTESSAGHNIGLRQRQQRRPGNMILRLAGQHRPQLVDMLLQRVFWIRDILTVYLLREPEMP